MKRLFLAVFILSLFPIALDFASAEEGPRSGIGNFNTGVVSYRKGIYNKALDSFNSAIASGDARLIAPADYNIGNSHYRIGSQKGQQAAKGIEEEYEAALAFYKRSMDLAPNDMDAKFNYEFVEKKLKELKESGGKSEEKEEKKKKDGGKEGVESKEKAGGEGGGKEGEERKEKAGGGEEEPRGGEEGKDKTSGSGKEGEENKEEENKGKQEEKAPSFESYNAPEEETTGEMTEGEAKMLLEGYKGEEATGRAIRLRRKPIEMPEPAKDW